MDKNPATSLSTTNSPYAGYEHINSIVDSLLQEAHLENNDVQTLAIGVGPGSYTGIRASIAFAQGWNLATGIKLAAISSVEALVIQATRLGWKEFHILIDAQRNEYYCGAFALDPEDEFPQKNGELQIITATATQALLQKSPCVAGPDLQKAIPAIHPLYPSAEDIARLAIRQKKYIEPESLAPIYLRPIQFVKAPPMRPLPL